MYLYIPFWATESHKKDCTDNYPCVVVTRKVTDFSCEYYWNGGAGGASRGRGPACICSGNMTGGDVGVNVVCDGAAAG